MHFLIGSKAKRSKRTKRSKRRKYSQRGVPCGKKFVFNPKTQHCIKIGSSVDKKLGLSKLKEYFKKEGVKVVKNCRSVGKIWSPKKQRCVSLGSRQDKKEGLSKLREKLERLN